MNISICSLLFDVVGNFMLEADFDKSDLSYLSRRVSRTATLDGKSTIVDNGYTASDAILNVVISKMDDQTRIGLLRLFRIHSRILVSHRDGVFQGVVESVIDKDVMKIKFLVEDKISG